MAGFNYFWGKTKCKREDLGNYKTADLAPVCGKNMEQIPMEAISRHMEEQEGPYEQPAQFYHGQNLLFQSDLYEAMPGFADAGSAADVLPSNFGKAFDTVFSSVLAAQVGRHKLVSQMTRCAAGLLGSKASG